MTPLLTLCLTLAAGAAPTTSTERTISVSGAAEVLVPPDVVQLLLAVETSDKTIAKAKAANDERTTRSLAVIKKFGIEPKDVQTDRLSMEPIYDGTLSYSARRASDPEGYQLRRSIVVTLRDVKRFEDLLAAVLESGANRIDGLEFRTSALRKHRDAARALALKAAREKAVAMTAELGCKLGKPLTISEGYAGAGLWAWSGGRGGQMSQNVVSQAPAGGAEGSEGFAPGQISVTANVSVSFELAD